MATRIKEYGAKVNGETYPCRLNDTVYSQGGVAAALGFTKPGTGVNFIAATCWSNYSRNRPRYENNGQQYRYKSLAIVVRRIKFIEC
jgi:hypothetical protein